MRYKARQMRKLKEQLINAMHCPTKYSRKHQKLSGGTPPATLARKNFTATTRSQLALIMTNLRVCEGGAGLYEGWKRVGERCGATNAL